MSPPTVDPIRAPSQIRDCISCSNHRRQIRAPRLTAVADAGGTLARAVGGERVEPIDDRAVAAMLVNQPVQRVATEATALRALDAEAVALTRDALPDQTEGQAVLQNVVRVIG